MSAPPTVIHFSVPDEPREPMIAHLRYDALRLAYIRREALGALDESWNAYGVYVLLGCADSAGYRAYVGQAQQLRDRIAVHARDRDKDWVSHVLLIARPDDPAFAFNLAEISWLEGHLHALLARAEACEIANRAPTGNSGLDETARTALQELARPISAALRVLGYPTATPEQNHEALASARQRPRIRHEATVADLVDTGLLAEGTELQPTTPLYEGEAHIGPGGTIVLYGEVYDKPSPAAEAVVGGQRNGWDFWGVVSGDGRMISLAELRSRLLDGVDDGDEADGDADTEGPSA